MCFSLLYLEHLKASRLDCNCYLITFSIQTVLQHFLNKLLFSSEATLYFPLCIRHVTLWGNMIFSAVIEDRQLKFSVKIHMTYAHLAFTWFVRLSFSDASKDIKQKFRCFVIFFSFLHILYLTFLCHDKP